VHGGSGEDSSAGNKQAAFLLFGDNQFLSPLSATSCLRSEAADRQPKMWPSGGGGVDAAYNAGFCGGKAVIV
jgi:hypothetical protein